jgi:O-antigen ligase
MKRLISDVFLGKLTSTMIVLLCFAYPISAILSLALGVTSTYVNGTFRAFILLVSIFIIIICAIKYKNIISISKYSISLVAFFFIYLLRLIWDLLVLSVYTDHTKYEIFYFYIGNILFPAIAVLMTFRFCDKRQIVKYSFYVLLVDNILMTIVYFFQNKWNFSPEILIQRAAIIGSSDDIFIINPISFGIYGGYLFLTSNSLILFLKELVPKPVIITGLIFGFVNLILSTSRGPFLFTLIGLIVLIFLFLYFSKKTLGLWRKVFISLFITFITLSIFISSINQNGLEIGIIQRALNLKENIQSGEKEERNELFAEGFNMFLESPLLGKKVVLDSTASYPHNVFIEILMSTGLMGFCLYIITLFFLFIKFLNINSYSYSFIFFLSVFILSYGISLTTGSLYQSVECWMLMILILAYRENKPVIA